MNEFKQIPVKITERINNLVDFSWNIFLNHYVNRKYEVNLEAPFQLHFGTILTKVGDLFLIKEYENISVNLEVNMPLSERKNYVDIVISYLNNKEGINI